MKQSSIYRSIWWGLLLLFICSCQRFFMPVRQSAATPAEKGAYISGNQPDKYFILRSGANAYTMKQITVDKDQFTMTCTLEAVPPEHRLYVNAGSNKYVYKDKPESASVLKEVHVYVKESVSVVTNQLMVIPLDQVNMIEVIEHDKSRTNTSYVLGGIGIGLGVIVLTGVIIALTKSSCPYVSVYNGEEYQLQGELFGGAINRRLERTDYVPLSVPLTGNQYRLRISNQLKERQYTNSAGLKVIEYPAHVTPLMDAAGKVYTVSKPVAPSEAWLNNTNTRNELLYKDGKACGFNDTTAGNGANMLRLVFPVNSEVKQAKLILRLKNSYWLDYLYGEFARRFGSDYTKWQQKQQQRPAAEMIRWTEEQLIPLQVSLKTVKGRLPLATLKTTGPLFDRDIVVPVDLSTLQGNSAELELSCGFMFWELDYAALDQSPDEFKEMALLQPVAATDEKGQSVRDELLRDDDRYLNQPDVGNTAELVYEWNQLPPQGYAQSVFLVTRGYYEPIREFTGKPDLAFLKKFREPAAMSKLSLNNWKQFIKESVAASGSRK